MPTHASAPSERSAAHDLDPAASDGSVPDDPTERRSSYALAMAVHVAAVSAAAVVLRRRMPRFRPLGVTDVIMTALATQRASRVLAKDPITSPLRAPFTTFVGVDGPAQLDERARNDSRLRHTVGELVTCPFCLGQWVGTSLVIAQLAWPRAGRVITSGLAAIGIADMLHHVEARLRSNH